MNLKVISAGAGSGKTYRLTKEMVQFLSGTSDYPIRASGIIATTFTKKAAAELQERVRTELLHKGMTAEADDLTNALIGTVHGLGVKLLKRFAYEAGVSPEVSIIADEDRAQFFNLALANILSPELVARLDSLCVRLDIGQNSFSQSWRKDVLTIADMARANAFTAADIQHSRDRSIETFFEFLPSPLPTNAEDMQQQLAQLLDSTIAEIEGNGDTSKGTEKYLNKIRAYRNTLRQQGFLAWRDWQSIASSSPTKKSLDATVELCELAEKVERNPQLQQDLRDYLTLIFDIVQRSIEEYDDYKKSRGLIDYIDMEILVNQLLDNPQVQGVMADELDLLMVDEFQDTSPIQLEIFLKLARFAQISVWVGDPKQSIYGFRGAEPRLMQAIIDAVGGVKPEDIQGNSWRSREDIVNAVNAVFVRAFPQIPPAQVALTAIRRKALKPNDPKVYKEDHIEQDLAVQHWHFDKEGRKFSNQNMPDAIAYQIRETLAHPVIIQPKSEPQARPLQAGDVAVLCRSNKDCLTVAEALHRAGLQAAIARTGLINTPEARLVMASIKYLLNRRDALSVAELMRLAEDYSLSQIVEERIDFLQHPEARPADWQAQSTYLQALRAFGADMAERSSVELLDSLIEELDLRRMVVRWGNAQQRLSNLDMLTRMARQYEDRCHRLQTAASLGGFLIYLQNANKDETDVQGSGESPAAVNVLTYHKSKGLEWPLVVCYNLHNKLRDNVMGKSIESDAETVDLDHILAHRWIRYWVSPFDDKQTTAPLLKRIAQSDWQQRITAESMAEEARLLYVGMTRARDYLVLPTFQKIDSSWLNRCFHRDDKVPTLDPMHYETPWVWDEQIVHKTNVHHTFGETFERYESNESDVWALTPRQGAQAFDALLIDVYKQKKGTPYSEANRQLVQQLRAQLQPQALPPHLYGTLHTAEDSDDRTNYRIVKACLMSDRATLPQQERLQQIQMLLNRLDRTPDNLEASEILRSSDAFQAWLNDTLQAAHIWRHYPIKLPYGARQFKEQIDYIVHTQQGDYILIDSRDVLRTWDQRKLPSDAAWFHLAESAIRQDLNIPMSGAAPRFRHFVHSVLECTLIELEMQ